MKILVLLIHLFCIPTFGAWPLQNFDDMVRDGLRWGQVGQADRASDILQIGLTYAPVSMAIAEGKDFKFISGLAGAQIATAGVTQLVKVWANRERPNGSDRRSFFSGHTSAAFAGAAVSCRMDKDYCLPGFVLAGATGYLRIAADKHWASDVLVGAAVGTSIGLLLPSVIWSW